MVQGTVGRQGAERHRGVQDNFWTFLQFGGFHAHEESGHVIWITLQPPFRLLAGRGQVEVGEKVLYKGISDYPSLDRSDWLGQTRARDHTAKKQSAGERQSHWGRLTLISLRKLRSTCEQNWRKAG